MKNRKAVEKLGGQQLLPPALNSVFPFEQKRKQTHALRNATRSDPDRGCRIRPNFVVTGVFWE